MVAASAWIGPNAVIGAGAVIGERCSIGPNCVIETGVRLGDDCRLQAGVTLCQGVIAGARCTFKAGAVVGSDGFGFAPDVDGYVKVPHLGSVRLGDDVEVGANTTIDRGTIEDTVIGDGVKLDNQVQVGHNCRIGAHTVIAGCVGISGSSIIGSRCMIGGAVGIAGHLEIGDEVVVTGYSLVTHSLPGPGIYSSGMPAIEAAKWRRTVARLHRLDARAGAARKAGRGTNERRLPDGHPGGAGAAAAPLPVPAGRPRHRMRARQAHPRDQERHRQRAVLPRTLSRPTRRCRAS